MNRALSIVLVAPEIHWNTGNLGRTSLAVGADLHLVEPLGFSLAEKEVRRAGLDYWPRVRLTVWPDWAHFARALPGLGEPFFFTAAAAPRPTGRFTTRRGRCWCSAGRASGFRPTCWPPTRIVRSASRWPTPSCAR